MPKKIKISSYKGLDNDLKKQRNEAIVMRADSLSNLDNNEKALDLIDIDNWDLWIKAANSLYEFVKVEQIEHPRD